MRTVRVRLRENKDLKMTAARVEEFMGRYNTTRASLFPAGWVAGQAAAEAASLEKEPTPYPANGGKNPADSYQIFLNASWEVDLWGKLRRRTEAARAKILSSEEGRTPLFSRLSPLWQAPT